MSWTDEPTSDGFIVCPEHGDIYWCEGANRATPLEAHTLEPLVAGIPQPEAGQEMLCPLCRARVHPEVRSRVSKIAPIAPEGSDV